MNEVLLAQFFVQIPHSSRGDSYQVGTRTYQCIPSLIPTGLSHRSFPQVIPTGHSRRSFPQVIPECHSCSSIWF